MRIAFLPQSVAEKLKNYDLSLSTVLNYEEACKVLSSEDMWLSQVCQSTVIAHIQSFDNHLNNTLRPLEIIYTCTSSRNGGAVRCESDQSRFVNEDGQEISGNYYEILLKEQLKTQAPILAPCITDVIVLENDVVLIVVKDDKEARVKPCFYKLQDRCNARHYKKLLSELMRSDSIENGLLSPLKSLYIQTIG